PYVIHVGQVLSLDPFPPLNYDTIGGQSRASAQGQRQSTPRSTATAMQEKRSYTVSPLSNGQKQEHVQLHRTIGPGAEQAPVAAGAAVGPGLQSSGPPDLGTPQPPPPLAPVVPPSQSVQEPQPTQPAKPAKPVEVVTNEAGWRWPVAPSVLASHEVESARHGVNLYGTEGAPIYAAHAGNVVYSGAGLQGIGKLVI